MDSATSQTNAGSYAVTANFVPADTVNYNTLTGLSAGTFTIDMATPIATLAVTNSPVTYDGSTHAPTVEIVSSVPAGGSVTNILTGGAANQTDVGTYPVTADFVPADTANYHTLTGLSAGSFVIEAVSGSNYDSWAAALIPPLSGGPSAVGPDGLTNLLVYALNLKTDGTNGSPGTLTGNVLGFTKRADAVTNNDVTYAILISTTLAADSWTEVSAYVENSSTTISCNLPTDVGGKVFARLVVTQTP
jgi:hypothetical protein